MVSGKLEAAHPDDDPLLAVPSPFEAAVLQPRPFTAGEVIYKTEKDTATLNSVDEKQKVKDSYRDRK